MKTTKIILAIVLIASMFSCKTLTDATSSDTVAKTTGIACGDLLKDMNTDYKTKGKVDITSTQTLSNVIQLSGYYKTLKNNKGNSEYKKAFASGLVTGSDNLITTENAMETVDKILSIDRLADIGSKTSSTASSAISVANSLNDIFKVL